MDISSRGHDYKTFGAEGEAFLQQLYVDTEAIEVHEKIKVLKDRLEIRGDITVDGRSVPSKMLLRCLEFELLEREQRVCPMYK